MNADEIQELILQQTTGGKQGLEDWLRGNIERWNEKFAEQRKRALAGERPTAEELMEDPILNAFGPGELGALGVTKNEVFELLTTPFVTQRPRYSFREFVKKFGRKNETAAKPFRGYVRSPELMENPFQFSPLEYPAELGKHSIAEVPPVFTKPGWFSEHEKRLTETLENLPESALDSVEAVSVVGGSGEAWKQFIPNAAYIQGSSPEIEIDDLMFYMHPATKQSVPGALAHESGHALVDKLRGMFDYKDMHRFHEALSDIMVYPEKADELFRSYGVRDSTNFSWGDLYQKMYDSAAKLEKGEKQTPRDRLRNLLLELQGKFYTKPYASVAYTVQHKNTPEERLAEALSNVVTKAEDYLPASKNIYWNIPLDEEEELAKRLLNAMKENDPLMEDFLRKGMVDERNIQKAKGISRFWRNFLMHD